RVLQGLRGNARGLVGNYPCALFRTYQTSRWKAGCSFDPTLIPPLDRAGAPESAPTSPFSGHCLDKTQPHSKARKDAGGRVETAAPNWGDSILSDATDHALATIASILDQGETQREGEKPASEASLVPPAEAPISPDGDGYSKLGPGPIAALRFRWTVRRAD